MDEATNDTVGAGMITGIEPMQRATDTDIALA